MLIKYLGSGDISTREEESLNILCDITSSEHYKALGLNIVLDLSDSNTLNNISIAHGVSLNLVQNSESFLDFARYMEKCYNVPYLVIQSESGGIEDLCCNLMAVADFFNFRKEKSDLINGIVTREMDFFIPKLLKYRAALKDKTISLFNIDSDLEVSLTKALEKLGIRVTSYDLGADIYIGRSSMESYSVKKGKCFCDIGFIKNIDKKGYQGLLRLYSKIVDICREHDKSIQICNKNPGNHTIMMDLSLNTELYYTE